jgi:hypothetical protein
MSIITLHCGYFVDHIPHPLGDFWGAVTITNHSGTSQFCEIEILEFNSGKLLKKAKLELGPNASILLDKNHPVFADIGGRMRFYIYCPNTITAMSGLSRGTLQGIDMFPVPGIDLPKS